MIDKVKLSSVQTALCDWQPFPDTAVMRLDGAAQWGLASQNLLSENERRLFVNLLGEKRRLSFVAGRLAAKIVAARLPALNHETHPAKIDIDRLENGAPVLRVRGFDMSDISISISHGGDFAIAGAVTGAHIGLDVEPVSRKCVALQDAFATADEVHILMNGTPNETETVQLTRLFSAKEAVAKCLGSHLYFALHHYRLVSAGADSLLLKDHSTEEMHHSVQTVIKENHVFSRLLCPKTD